jgi:hypothetical protein
MHDNAKSFLSAVPAHAPRFADKITPHLTVSLADYLHQSISTDTIAPHATYAGYTATALHVFLTQIQQGLTYTDKEADDISAGFLTHPVMQQADHSGLLLDPEILLNNVLYSIACKSQGVSTSVMLQCSTVKCVTRLNPTCGPTYLQHDGAVYKVFDQSKRTLKDTNICCLPRDISFWLRSDDDKSVALNIVDTARAYPTAEDAFIAANDVLWQAWQKECGVARVAVDERYTSELAALHLDDPASPLHALLFDQKTRDAFFAIRADMAARQKQFVSAVTDFFWFKKDGRLLPLRVGNDDYAAVGVDYTPQGLATGLRAGVLYADKYIAYMVRALLPGILAVGGTSQQDYMALFQQMTLETHAAQSFLPGDLMGHFKTDLSRLGGRPLLEPDADLQRAMTAFSRAAFMPALMPHLDKPLSQTIGTLGCASYLLYANG